MISETKIIEIFPSRHFYIEGSTRTYRLDQNCHQGGILVYAREDIPSKLIEINGSVKSIFIKLRLRKRKWLLNFCCNANNSNICDHLRSLWKSLDTFLTNYEKVFLIGDLKTRLTFILRIFVIYTSLRIWWKFEHILKIRIIPRFDVDKISTQFWKLMCSWNRFIWLSENDSYCH